MGSGLLRYFPASAHDSGQVLTFQGKSGPGFGAFTITTHRGDQHLTTGLPAILAHYEQAAGLERLKRIVVDREGMAAELLAALAGEGRTVITVLRTDQYSGLESFRQVGEFLSLQVDRQGKVIREVALARFGLPLPEHQGRELEVQVALIRDWRRLVPKVPHQRRKIGPCSGTRNPMGPMNTG
jgi:hypothetical protein